MLGGKSVGKSVTEKYQVFRLTGDQSMAWRTVGGSRPPIDIVDLYTKVDWVTHGQVVAAEVCAADGALRSAPVYVLRL